MKKVVIVDDMKSARVVLSKLLESYPQLEVVEKFNNGKSFLEYFREHDVDLVFLDIEMPEIDGIEVSKILSQSKKKIYFAFATAFSSYSLVAWGTNAIGYITKPYDKADVQKVIERFLELSPIAEKKILIECFPNFNMFVDNKPIEFKSKKAKEILAYLVYNKGGWVSVNEMCVEVLDNLEGKQAKDSFRSYMSRLLKTLDVHDISGLVEKQYGKCRVKRELFSCDFYQYLEGETSLYTGEFLKSYSWSEPTQAIMESVNLK